MTAEPVSFFTAFLIGLLSGAHCIGMCGGIMNALSFAIPGPQGKLRRVTPILLLYNGGRIFSYAVAGAIAGSLSGWLQQTGSAAAPGLRVVAGLMLIAMGLYLAGWWRGLTHLEKLGGYAWKYLQPLGNHLMPVTQPHQAAILGMIWGWLPCGLVYSTLTLSAASSGWQQSSLIMLSFGFGTLPAMLLTGVFAHQVKAWIQKTTVRNIAALLVIGFGIWTIAWVAYHQVDTHGNHHNHTTLQPDISRFPVTSWT